MLEVTGSSALTEEVLAFIRSTLGREPVTFQSLTCEEAISYAGEAWREWVADRTEAALGNLYVNLDPGPDREFLARGEMEILAFRVGTVQALLDDWERCGGRFMYLRQLVSAINDRRAELLDAMDNLDGVREHPTSLSQWARLVRHRLVAHLADSAGDGLDADDAETLAWTAAMALEAALTLQSGSEPIDAMLDAATQMLAEAFDHGHRVTTQWLECAAHTSLEIASRKDTDSEAAGDDGDPVSALLAVHAHLAGAITQAGQARTVCDHHARQNRAG